MTREQAINYLIISGFSEEQVSEVVRALTYEPTIKNDNQILEDIKGEILEQYWGDSRKEYFYDNDSKEYKDGAIEAADYIIKMIDKRKTESEVEA